MVCLENARNPQTEQSAVLISTLLRAKDNEIHQLQEKLNKYRALIPKIENLSYCQCHSSSDSSPALPGHSPALLDVNVLDLQMLLRNSKERIKDLNSQLEDS